jgi:hypothetical protein
MSNSDVLGRGPYKMYGRVMGITAAEKVLIVGGVLNLAVGVLLGYPIIVTRSKGATATPRYLMAAHIGTLCMPRCCSAWYGRPSCRR